MTPDQTAWADQLGAATEAAGRWLDGLPTTGPTTTAPAGPIVAQVAHLAGPWPWCHHLAARPVQPMVADLDRHLVMCTRCAALPLPPPPEPVPCGWCGADDLPTTTVAVQVAALTAIGRCCQPCSAANDSD